MRRRNFSPATIRRRRSVLRGFERWIVGDLLQVDAATIELYLDVRAPAGRSARTRHHYLSDIRCFFDWAIDSELIERNVARSINPPRLPTLLPRPISEEDLAYALEHAEPLMRVWLTLAGYAGLRCIEICRLNVDDILWHEGSLRIFGKGNRERLVDIHPLVELELRAFGVPRSGPVFQRPRGTRWPADCVSRLVSEYLTAIGVDATAHQFRHRFGTKLYEQCRDIRVVQEAMGHASTKTTDKYVRYSRTAMRSAILALPAPTPQVEHATEQRSRTSTRAAGSVS